jgi:hypothetical protein
VEDAGEAVLLATIGRRDGNLGRPKELLIALFDLAPERLLDVKIHKLESFVEFDGQLVSVGLGWASAARFDPWAAGHAGNGFARRRRKRAPDPVPAGR